MVALEMVLNGRKIKLFTFEEVGVLLGELNLE